MSNDTASFLATLGAFVDKRQGDLIFEHATLVLDDSIDFWLPEGLFTFQSNPLAQNRIDRSYRVSPALWRAARDLSEATIAPVTPSSPQATVTLIQGAAAAARILGVSDRTVRRWLGRCPESHWPSASRPGNQAAWTDEADMRQWWSLKATWPKKVTHVEAIPPKRRRRSAKATGAKNGDERSILDRVLDGD